MGDVKGAEKSTEKDRERDIENTMVKRAERKHEEDVKCTVVAD